MRWTDVSFTIDGKPIDIDISEVSYDHHSAEREIGADRISVTHSGRYDVKFDPFTIAKTDRLSFFFSEPAGASHDTLVRRLRYGGRKGRAARRRLLARGLLVEIATATGTHRGRAAALDETTFLLELQQRAVCKEPTR